MAIQCETKNGVGVVTVTGALNAPVAESFHTQFVAWFDNQPGLLQVAVDLGGVGFIDSLGLGALISVFKHVAERGGDMRLVRPQQAVKLVLEITRTSRILRMFGTLEEALRDAAR
ncbi:MAG: STAS domain-containing protein [Verrucomicrobia bacterium]|nr:STAS domain-containing protein [Verrucomicrobiota bacterium]